MLEATPKRPTQAHLLKERLLLKISTSAIGSKLPNERAMAQEYGVCRATVSAVMGELEREGYVNRRVGSGTFVALRDKAVHREPEGTENRGAVLIAYPDFFSYSLFQQVHYSEVLALKRNYNLVNLKLQPLTDFATVLEMARKTPNLRGVMIAPPSVGISDGFVRELDEFGVPVILFYEFGKTTLYRNIWEVNFDHFKSGYLRMKALLDAGHREIGFVDNEAGLTMNSLPVRGMRQALREYDIPYKAIRHAETAAQRWQEGMRIGYVQTHELMAKYPEVTAILYDTILGAFGGLRALYELKLRCPDDISIVTSMEHMGFEGMSCPSLCTVRDDYFGMITRCFDVIDNPESDATGSRSLVIDLTLDMRESIASPRNNRK